MKSWVLQIITEQERRKYEDLINYKKSQNKVFTNANLTLEEEKFLLRILEIYLLTVIENFHLGYDYPLNAEFVNINKVCFDIYQVLPVPQDSFGKIKHIFNLIIFAYLSNNIPQIQQFLVQNESFWNVTDDDRICEKTLFIDLTKSIAYMVIKRYDKSLYIINRILKNLFPSDVNEYNTLLKLFGFALIFKSIERACKYMQGEINDEDILTDLEIQINKGNELIERAGAIEVYVLINFLVLVIRQMIIAGKIKNEEQNNS